MKNWIKKTTNQFYLFCIIITSLPLLLIKEVKSFPGIVTICLWAFAIYIITFIKIKSDKYDENGNRTNNE